MAQQNPNLRTVITFVKTSVVRRRKRLLTLLLTPKFSDSDLQIENEQNFLRIYYQKLRLTLF